VLCPECRAVLSGGAPRRVRPVPEPPGLPAVHAAAPYADEVRAALLAHKERGALALAGPLGAALAVAVRVGLQEARRRACGALTGPDGGSVTGPWAEGAGALDAFVGRDAARAVRAEDPGARDGLTGSDAARAVRSGRGGAWPGSGDARPGTGGARPGTGGAWPGVDDAWPGNGGAPVLLVPVPSARGAVRARGHDPARRIALAAAGELRRTGTPARVLAVLRQRRAVADQSGLNSRQRLDNLGGALEVAAGGARLLVGGSLVLVDDLMTTGASLTEAARAVRAAVAEAAIAYGEVTTAGCTGATREGGEEQPSGSTDRRTERSDMARGARGIVGTDGTGDLICAAVVAASPDSFEINRN
jgi:predicted amidophosphoribosyltransferase